MNAGASLGMAGVLLWLTPAAATWLDWSLSRRALQLAMVVLAGGGTYLLLHLMAGTRLSQLRTPGSPA